MAMEKGDPQKAMEAMEYLARGPKGEQGTRGDKGDRGQRGEGMTRGTRRAVVFLLAITVALSAASILFTVSYVNSSNRKFCEVISGIVPVPRPADPAANPSRETDYEQYARFVRLGRSLGCAP
jgi:hypothetical protein